MSLPCPDLIHDLSRQGRLVLLQEAAVVIGDSLGRVLAPPPVSRHSAEWSAYTKTNAEPLLVRR
jgi:hypothetical protein